MMRTKEIYYKNRVYKISMDDLKHINGYDVAKLPSEIYVYYDDLDSKWKLANETLIEEYTGKKYIDVEIDNKIIKAISYIDLEEHIFDKKVTKINVEYVVMYDENQKIWKIINDDKIYKEYNNNLMENNRT